MRPTCMVATFPAGPPRSSWFLSGLLRLNVSTSSLYLFDVTCFLLGDNALAAARKFVWNFIPNECGSVPRVFKTHLCSKRQVHFRRTLNCCCMRNKHLSAFYVTLDFTYRIQNCITRSSIFGLFPCPQTAPLSHTGRLTSMLWVIPVTESKVKCFVLS